MLALLSGLAMWVIFSEERTDLQKIADDGVYLNQLLLDRGLAEVF